MGHIVYSVITLTYWQTFPTLQIIFKCEEVPSFSIDYIIQSLFDTASYTITTNGSDTDNNNSVTIDNIMGNNYYHVDVIIRYVDGEVLIENITQISELLTLLLWLLLDKWK